MIRVKYLIRFAVRVKVRVVIIVSFKIRSLEFLENCRVEGWNLV